MKNSGQARNKNLTIFRFKTALALAQWRDKMRLLVAENEGLGMSRKALREMKEGEDSRWAIEREALRKALMKEAAGFINRLHGWASRGGSAK